MAVRNQSDRINFGKLREVIVPPNLIEIQITSYLDFLQKGIPEKQRKPQGLEAVFREVFPIESYDARLNLEYVSYTLGDSKNTEIECIREGITYSVPLYVKLRLREEDFIKDEEIYSQTYVSIKEIEELFFEMGDDFNTWDEKEKGQYPIQRTLDAMKNFIEYKKRISNGE